MALLLVRWIVVVCLALILVPSPASSAPASMVRVDGANVGGVES